jgi:NAD(P)H dehydrogenase (quinone)
MIVVTGATGQLGRLVIEKLLKRVKASDIAVVVRNREKAGSLAALGIEVRQADYDKPETLRNAFRGADQVLLISANEVGKRLAQHRNVIEAAKADGAKLIVYTSLLNADKSGIGTLAKEHFGTEELIRKSGIPFVILRNGWYIENYSENLGPALQYGAIAGAAGDGKVAAATREDYAEAAAAVLTGSGHEGKIYELAGDRAFSMSELAGEVAKASGKTVTYNDLPPDKYRDMLVGVGVPAPVAEMLSDADLGLKRGELDSKSGDLRRLIGRPTTEMSSVIRDAVRKQR